MEDIFSVSATGNAIVYDKTHHDISSLITSVGYILANAFLPGPIAIDSIRGLTSITPLVLAGAW
jgi:hypothetical protein